LAANFGHFDAWRIWKDILLFAFCLLAGWIAVSRPSVWRALWRSWPIRIMAAYLALTVLMTIYGVLSHNVSHSAAIYGLIVNTRLFAFFGTVYIYMLAGGDSLLVHGRNTDGRPMLLRRWRQLVFIPAAIVVIFGLAQIVLPAGFLTHFGYGPATIPAYQTVDNKPDYVRLQSTLRGPNPLGAYLAVTIPLLAAVLVYAYAKQKSNKIATNSQTNLGYALLSAGALVVLYGTYSRSAWLATFAAIGLVLWLAITNNKVRKIGAVLGAALLVIALTAVFMLRNNDTFQNVIFHTNEKSTSSTSSNESRAQALENGWRDVLTHPLGEGVGSAGPASNRLNNGKPAKISENYFLQIAQEAGWAGLALLVAVYILTGVGLYKKRGSALALGLFAALCGLTIVALLSHAWTDDTLAYLFWGLAAVGIGSPGQNAR
jgi:hypothetical protein